jgi:hypothetical protein
MRRSWSARTGPPAQHAHMHRYMAPIPYFSRFSIEGSIGGQEQKSQRCLSDRLNSQDQDAPGLASEPRESTNPIDRCHSERSAAKSKDLRLILSCRPENPRVGAPFGDEIVNGVSRAKDLLLSSRRVRVPRSLSLLTSTRSHPAASTRHAPAPETQTAVPFHLNRPACYKTSE